MKFKRPAILIGLVLTLATSLFAESGTIKILGVGNSFTRNATKYLPQIFESVPGAQAEVGAAMIGGCSLDRHVKHAREHEADPATGKHYRYLLNGEEVKKGASLKEILLSGEWDFITIQQVSTKSYEEESFYPYARELIDYIRRYCPDAEIVMHETWSHSVNSYRMKEWKLDPDEMYARLHANYAKVATENDLRVIPVGTAFQNARATNLWDLQPDGFDPKNHDLTYPEDRHNLPDMSRSLTYDYSWRKQKDGEWSVNSDGYHANANGEYLGGLVWFEFFTGRDARAVAYQPEGMSEVQGKSLRAVAHATVQAEKVAAPAMVGEDGEVGGG